MEIILIAILLEDLLQRLEVDPKGVRVEVRVPGEALEGILVLLGALRVIRAGRGQHSSGPQPGAHLSCQRSCGGLPLSGTAPRFTK